MVRLALMLLAAACVCSSASGAAPSRQRATSSASDPADRRVATRFLALAIGAEVAIRDGRPAATVRLADRALELLRSGKVRASALGFALPLAAGRMQHLAGAALGARGLLAEAVRRLEAAVEAYENAGPPDSIWLVQARDSLARALYKTGRRERAEELFEVVAEGYRRYAADANVCDGSAALLVLSDRARRQGDILAAEAFLEEALEWCRDAPTTPAVVLAREDLADYALRRGDVVKAIAMAEELILALEATAAEPERQAAAWLLLADALERLARTAEARAAARMAERLRSDEARLTSRPRPTSRPRVRPVWRQWPSTPVAAVG